MKTKIVGERLMWKCPVHNCGDHSVPIEGKNKWEWNRDSEHPTLTPSVRVTWQGLERDAKTVRICHFFLENGIVKFCSDCTHELRGKEVVLPELDN